MRLVYSSDAVREAARKVHGKEDELEKLQQENPELAKEYAMQTEHIAKSWKLIEIIGDKITGGESLSEIALALGISEEFLRNLLDPMNEAASRIWVEAEFVNWLGSNAIYGGKNLTKMAWLNLIIRDLNSLTREELQFTENEVKFFDYGPVRNANNHLTISEIRAFYQRWLDRIRMSESDKQDAIFGLTRKLQLISAVYEWGKIIMDDKDPNDQLELVGCLQQEQLMRMSKIVSRFWEPAKEYLALIDAQ